MEKKLGKWLAVVMVIALVAVTVSPVFAAKEKQAKKSECITCHEKETLGIVKQFLSGKMGKILPSTTTASCKNRKGGTTPRIFSSSTRRRARPNKSFT
jgi:cytochrome c553